MKHHENPHFLVVDVNAHASAHMLKSYDYNNNNIMTIKVFCDIMVLASPRPRPSVDLHDVKALTRKILNGSLSNCI